MSFLGLSVAGRALIRPYLSSEPGLHQRGDPRTQAVTDELGRPLRGGLLHFLRLRLIANNTN